MYKKNSLTGLVLINMVLLAIVVYASSRLTIEFFGSIGTGQVRVSNFLLAIVNDTSKVFLPICVGIAFYREKYVMVLILTIITLATVIISFGASQALDLNVGNSQLLKGSKKKEIISIRDSLAAEKQKLLQDREVEIDTYKKELNSLPGNYYTNSMKLSKTIEDTSKRYNDMIRNKEMEIEKYNNMIVNYNESGELTTEGYHALAKSLNISVDVIMKWKNILLELLALVLSLNLGLLLAEKRFFGSMYDKKKEKTEKVKERELIVQKQKEEDEDKKKIEISEINDIDLQKFYKAAQKTASKDGRCIGYKKIGEMANVSNSYSLREELIKKGLLINRKNGTFINKGA